MKISILYIFLNFFEKILRNLVVGFALDSKEVEGDPTDDDLGTSYLLGGSLFLTRNANLLAFIYYYPERKPPIIFVGE